MVFRAKITHHRAFVVIIVEDMMTFCCERGAILNRAASQFLGGRRPGHVLLGDRCVARSNEMRRASSLVTVSGPSRK